MRTYLTNFILAAVIAVPAGVALPVSSAHSEQHQPSAQEQVDETYEAIADFTHEQKSNVVAWFERRLSEIDARREALAEKAGEVRDEAAENMKELRAEIDESSEDAQRKLRDLKKASAKAWEGAKRDMKGAFDRLETAIESAESTEG